MSVENVRENVQDPEIRSADHPTSDPSAIAHAYKALYLYESYMYVENG